jgi:hypothetical protein
MHPVVGHLKKRTHHAAAAYGFQQIVMTGKALILAGHGKVQSSDVQYPDAFNCISYRTTGAASRALTSCEHWRRKGGGREGINYYPGWPAMGSANP